MNFDAFFFKFKVENSIFVSAHRLQSYVTTQRWYSMKQIKMSAFFLSDE